MAAKGRSAAGLSAAPADVDTDAPLQKKGTAKSGPGGRGGRVESASRRSRSACRSAREGQEGPEEGVEAENLQEEDSQEGADGRDNEEAREAQVQRAVTADPGHGHAARHEAADRIPNAVFTGHAMVWPTRLGSVMKASSGTLTTAVEPHAIVPIVPISQSGSDTAKPSASRAAAGPEMSANL